MKQRILLTIVAVGAISMLQAQKVQKTTAFAITGIQKGQSNWTEVRLVDITTGNEVKSIYQSSQEVQIFNARTGKPVVKKDVAITDARRAAIVEVHKEMVAASNSYLDPTGSVRIVRKDGAPAAGSVKKIVINERVQYDKPFATTSAACAYDKKHERLYYTPIGINQLRYIDLKSGTPKVYYFEDEPFGALKNSRDVPNQITRMVIASDGDGYALTNDANHLIQFTTGKKPQISDLGALTDDAANGSFSVHSQGGFGGDIIADAQKNLYLVAANRAVFKISLESRVASYLGTIKGLPKGFSTNGAVVEGGSNVIVSSSSSTQGYFRFDLNTLQAEKVSTGTAVFNASDLANGTLAFEKKKKEKKFREIKPVEVVSEPEDRVVEVEKTGKPVQPEELQRNFVSVYPNPVSIGGVIRLSFNDQPLGKYQVQFMDVAGKIISQQELNINNKVQVEEFRIPSLITSGNYLVKIYGEGARAPIVNKLVVQ